MLVLNLLHLLLQLLFSLFFLFLSFFSFSLSLFLSFSFFLFPSLFFPLSLFSSLLLLPFSFFPLLSLLSLSPNKKITQDKSKTPVVLYLFDDKLLVQSIEGGERKILDLHADVMWIRDVPFRTLHCFEIQFKNHGGFFFFFF